MDIVVFELGILYINWLQLLLLSVILFIYLFTSFIHCITAIDTRVSLYYGYAWILSYKRK